MKSATILKRGEKALVLILRVLTDGTDEKETNEMGF